MANWSELPEDITDLFLNRLRPCVEDFVTFGAVCKSWRSVTIAKKNQQSNTSFMQFSPWLMLAKRENDSDESVRSFYCLYSKRIFNIKLPQIIGTRCWGSPYGWLVTIGTDLNIHLVHPLSGKQLSLPSQPTFPDQFEPHANPENLCMWFVDKFVLASNPSYWSTTSNQCCVVMAFYGGVRKIAFAAPGDEAWTSLEGPPGAYEDIILFNGQFYAINTEGYLRICEVNKTTPKATAIASPPKGIYPSNQFYLMEMFGDLHLISREFMPYGGPACDFHYDTTDFEVYKFNFDTKSWTEVYDLKDQVLFVGSNTSFAISTSDYPEFNGGSIYFTDDHCECYDTTFCDMGVFDFDEMTVEPFHCGNDAISKFSRPTLLLPSL